MNIVFTLHTLLLLFGLITVPIFAVNLGVVRDFKDAAGENLISYSAIVRFKKQQDLKDLAENQPNKIVNLAKIAYDEMEAVHREESIDVNKLPAVMVAMAWENEIFFASSMKGSRNVFHSAKSGKDDNSAFDYVRDILKACQTETHPNHRYFGSCGEPNVIDLYYKHSKPDLNNEEPTNGFNGLLIAWNGKQRRVVKPCTEFEDRKGKRYGCKDIIAHIWPDIVVKESGREDNRGQDDVFSKFSPAPRVERLTADKEECAVEGGPEIGGPS